MIHSCSLTTWPTGSFIFSPGIRFKNFLNEYKHPKPPYVPVLENDTATSVPKTAIHFIRFLKRIAASLRPYTRPMAKRARGGAVHASTG